MLVAANREGPHDIHAIWGKIHDHIIPWNYTVLSIYNQSIFPSCFFQTKDQTLRRWLWKVLSNATLTTFLSLQSAFWNVPPLFTVTKSPSSTTMSPTHGLRLINDASNSLLPFLNSVFLLVMWFVPFSKKFKFDIHSLILLFFQLDFDFLYCTRLLFFC